MKLDMIYKTLKILKAKDVYLLNVVLTSYNIKHNDICSDLKCSIFRLNTSLYAIRSHENFLVPFPRTNTVMINYTYQFPKILNSFPNNTLDGENILVVKRRIKEQLLSQY